MIERINIYFGAFITFLVAIFGKYYILFLGFLILNFVDYITGWIKARMLHTSSSEIGAKGALKKVAYWVVIGISFFITTSFSLLGEKIGINLSFVVLFGWLTLASYLVNEMRSILENFVEMGINVPTFLIVGLKVANDKINNKEDIQLKEDE